MPHTLPSSVHNIIKEYFAKLHLSPEITAIYIALYEYGPQHISELSRRSGVERTRIYRMIKQLKETALIEIDLQSGRTLFQAAPISNVQILLSKKEQEMQELQHGLTILQEKINQQESLSLHMQVKFYEGANGIKQMMWNQTRAPEGNKNYSILYDNMQSRTQSKFFERWAAKCNEKKMVFRGIVCDHFIKSQQDWYRTRNNERLKDWQARYVSDDQFMISYSTIIYSDIVAYYNWRGREIFGVEIHNKEVADTQKQFFEMLWNKALPVDDLKGPQPEIAGDSN